MENTMQMTEKKTFYFYINSNNKISLLALTYSLTQ